MISKYQFPSLSTRAESAAVFAPRYEVTTNLFFYICPAFLLDKVADVSLNLTMNAVWRSLNKKFEG